MGDVSSEVIDYTGWMSTIMECLVKDQEIPVYDDPGAEAPLLEDVAFKGHRAPDTLWIRSDGVMRPYKGGEELLSRYHVAGPNTEERFEQLEERYDGICRMWDGADGASRKLLEEVNLYHATGWRRGTYGDEER